MALNKKTGAVIWKCAVPGGDKAAFPSAIVVEVGGTKQYVQLLQKGLVGVDARTGRFLWRYAKPVSRFDANIPTPHASDGYIYVGSAGTGGGAVKLKVKDSNVEPEEVYFGPKYSAAIGGVVKIGNYLYGTTAAAMLCIEFTTGKVNWEERAPRRARPERGVALLRRWPSLSPRRERGRGARRALAGVVS